MKAKLVKESLNDIFKPKTEEELGDRYREMKQKTDVFMTKIFSDLHQDHKDPNVYRNGKGKWMFEHNLKNEGIFVNYDRVWVILQEKLNVKDDIIKLLIERWLKENTDWPRIPIVWAFQKPPKFKK